MELKLKNVLSTLSRAPAPEYPGQILRMQVLHSSDDFLTRSSEGESAQVIAITLRAERYRRNDLEWLEWMIDI